MRIYKDGNKVIVEMSSSDVIFNDGSKEMSTVYLDVSVQRDVNFVIPVGTTVISGLNADEYEELRNTLLAKVHEIQERKPSTIAILSSDGYRFINTNWMGEVNKGD
jgi:hypothetical protein